MLYPEKKFHERTCPDKSLCMAPPGVYISTSKQEKDAKVHLVSVEKKAEIISYDWDSDNCEEEEPARQATNSDLIASQKLAVSDTKVFQTLGPYLKWSEMLGINHYFNWKW